MLNGIKEADIIIVICSPSFKTKAENPNNNGVSFEVRLINDIIKQRSKPVVPVILPHIDQPIEEILPSIYYPNLRIKFNPEDMSELKNIIRSNLPFKAW